MMKTQSLQTVPAIAIISLIAVGANAQRPVYRYTHRPYRIVYRYGSVDILNGRVPVAISPTIGVGPYITPTYIAPPVVNYGYYPAPYNVNRTGAAAPANYAVPNGNSANSGSSVMNAASSSTPNNSVYGSSRIVVRRSPSGAIILSWQGDTQRVSQITYALLDANYVTVQSKSVTAMPNQARFSGGPNAAYDRVIVQYLNGMTNTITMPL